MQKQFWRIFLISVLVTLIAGGTLLGVGVVAYRTMIYQAPRTDSSTNNTTHLEIKPDYITNELDKTINKTVVVLGTDISGRLTDTIMVGNINSETNKIHIFSVPRDTQVEWSESQRKLLPPENSWVTMSKLNEMSAWGGMENVREITVNQLERILGMKIDNYVIVSLSAFREIVDIIGGVEVNVPQRMYKEEVNGGLRIDLQAGVQVLDGYKAEQFVRFRDYATGDLGRIQAQQQFVNACIQKILSPEIILKIPELVGEIFGSVKTDATLTELMGYMPYLKAFKTSDVGFYMLPGSAQTENGISYYRIDLDATDELLKETIFAED